MFLYMHLQTLTVVYFRWRRHLIKSIFKDEDVSCILYSYKMKMLLETLRSLLATDVCIFICMYVVCAYLTRLLLVEVEINQSWES